MRRPVIPIVVALAVAVGAPGSALAHGEKPEAGEEAEIEQLAQQPARALAQQAHALLHIRRDAHEAGVRLDAALESRDQREVDVPILRRAAETLDGGDPVRAQVLIDEALSRPLGAASGKLFHGGGREFRPATGAQEIAGIVGGAAALLLGALGLWAARRRGRARPAAG
jgi:LPXTG-motif cell wall-anchored protein